jgi:hypothetical protein
MKRGAQCAIAASTRASLAFATACMVLDPTELTRSPVVKTALSPDSKFAVRRNRSSIEPIVKFSTN